MVKEETIVHFLEENVQKFPDKVFLRWRTSDLKECTATYGEFYEQVNRIANVLKELGVKKGENVGLILNNVPELIFSLFAVFKMGAVANPTNPKLRGDGLAFILNNSEEKLAVTDKEHIAAISALSAPLLSLNTILSINGISADTIQTSSGNKIKTVNFQTVIKETSSKFAMDNLTGDDGCSLIYSSGTTGKNPKGAFVNHKNYLIDTQAMIAAGKLNQNDVGFCFLPLFHVFGLVSAISTPVVVGSSTRIADFMNEVLINKLLFKTIETDKITSFGAVPTMLKYISGSYEKPAEDISSLKYIFSGGGPLSIEIYEEFKNKFGIEILQGWGQSEGVCGFTVNPVDSLNKPRSIGKPFPGIEIKIMSYTSEDGANVSLIKNSEGYDVGEIVVTKGPMMVGYYNNPQGTKEVFDENKHLHTGDIGYVDNDGYFYIVDRKKDMVVRGGENHYTGPIEDAIVKSGFAYMVAVYGIENKIFGQVIAASVIPSPGINKDSIEDKIRDYCKKNGVFPPDIIILESGLPMNDVGKVLKRQLRETHKDKGLNF